MCKLQKELDKVYSKHNLTLRKLRQVLSHFLAVIHSLPRRHGCGYRETKRINKEQCMVKNDGYIIMLYKNLLENLHQNNTETKERNKQNNKRFQST